MNSDQSPIDFAKTPQANKTSYLSYGNCQELALLPVKKQTELLTKSLYPKQAKQVNQELEEFIAKQAVIAERIQRQAERQLAPVVKALNRQLFSTGLASTAKRIINDMEVASAAFRAAHSDLSGASFAVSAAHSRLLATSKLINKNAGLRNAGLQIAAKALASHMHQIAKLNYLDTSFIEGLQDIAKPLVNSEFDPYALSKAKQLSEDERIDNSIQAVDETADGLVISSSSTHIRDYRPLIYEDRAAIRIEIAKDRLNPGDIELLRQLADPARPPLGSGRLIGVSEANIIFEGGYLVIGTHRIKLAISSKYAALARLLTKSKNELGKHWDIKEIVKEAFGEDIDADEPGWTEKIRQYVYWLNSKIKVGSNGQIDDFFIRDRQIYVYINPKYLKS